MADEHLYVQATAELESGNYSKALWTKSFNLCKGDEQQAFYKYVDLRVEQLRAIDGSDPLAHNSMTDSRYPYTDSRAQYHEQHIESVRLEPEGTNSHSVEVHKKSIPIYLIVMAGLFSVGCQFYHHLSKVLGTTFTTFISTTDGSEISGILGEAVGGALLLPLLIYGISFLFKAKQSTRRTILFYGFLITGIIHLCMIFNINEVLRNFSTNILSS